VVLGVTGGIAAYKSVQIARDLTALGAEVDVVLTPTAKRFVGALSFSGVTGRPVQSRMLSAGGGALHVRLGSEADAVVVAPATADLIARLAQGRADDLLTAVVLAAKGPVLLAPAMNDRMFAHPQTVRNLEHCREVLGYRIVGPTTGALAVGEGEGAGRMLEPEEIREHLGRAIGADSAYAGRRVLVTAGPTREPIDPVRYVGNRSSGRMGFALAREAWLRGADVVLLTGPSELAPPTGVTVRRVESAREMVAAAKEEVPAAHYLFFAAAVSDFRPAEMRSEKIKRARSKDGLSLDLVENPDVIVETIRSRRPNATVVGFALETEDMDGGATRKLAEKKLDLVVGNDPGEPGAGFEVPTNRVTLYFGDRTAEALPLMTKEAAARVILDRSARVAADKA
jgi:phosphopantothenoylcysteine decarboxylase/phosphopantothenate--cysteine ligase